ncbi:MAG: pantetheine-phosphate adenylyltransferase [Rhodospirillaceae bacterium]|nr:pantetheine-phosphate adenylyltransferase [Rhodospirillaceae bacterium]
MNDMRIGVYPGTFDPITSGHTDIVKRALRVVDHLVIGVAVNTGKSPLFNVDERVDMVMKELKPICGDRISVRNFDNLLMHFVEEVQASIIIRGLRALSYFEYEFQMTGMNARLNNNVETVFLMASENHQFIASKLVKEIAALGGDISSFVSPEISASLIKRIKSKNS